MASPINPASDFTASILVVDDEPFNVDLLSQELEDMGHAPASASDGRSAMQILAKAEFDLVLLDIMMPDMNGFQVLEALKASGRLSDLPVVVVSAIDDIENVARCLLLGAEDHLVKPFEPALLRARIANALEKKRLRDKVTKQLTATRALFGRYVPPGVAEYVLARNGNIVPAQQEVSVLCLDIVGFTSIAESMDPAEVMRLLNEYFEAVIEPLSEHGGVINEFLGDGMVISFNLPRPVERHADQAVSAAFAIQKLLSNRSFCGHRLAARIGVHTGMVIAGNVAAGSRLHYTILGDTVNTASRLEVANKEYQTKVLISGETEKQLTLDFGLNKLGKVQIRGKSDRTSIYTRRM